MRGSAVLTQEQNTKRISAAVSGNRAAGASDEDLAEGGKLTDKLRTHLNRFFIAACVCNENAVKVDPGGVTDPVSNVLLEYGGELAAIFLSDRHFSVAHFNARLEVQQIGTQCCKGGTAPTLMEKFQIVDHKRCVHPGSERPAGLCDLRSRFAGFDHFTGGNDQQTAAGGKIARVHNINIFKVSGGKACVLVGGGHLRTDGKENDSVPLFGTAFKKVGVVRNVDRGGFRKLSGLFVMRIYFLGTNVHAVGIVFAAEINAKRNDPDTVTRNQICTEIRCAVTCY